MFWGHYFIVKLNCFILRTTTVAGLGVPIFRGFTVIQKIMPLQTFENDVDVNCNNFIENAHLLSKD